MSGSYDNLAIIWNVTQGKSLCALKKHTAMVSSLALVKRDIVITGSWDRTLAIW
jgi:WD40 repeat protein